jgi:WD40 repeat protein
VQVLKGSPIIELTKTKGGGNTEGNQSFTSPIGQASFFFGDRFIAAAYGSAVLVYNFVVDVESSDSKRLQNHSKYKLATQAATATKVSCFGSCNSPSSSVLIAATTDHALSIFDIATGAMLRAVQSAHDRPIHRVALLRAGAGTQLPAEAHNTFVTASTDSTIKLWDLRSVSCVRRFEGHNNRTHKVGTAISPCAKFIATGSEDKSVVLYDIG